YSGDNLVAGSIGTLSPDQTVTFTQATSTTSVTSSLNPAEVGNVITFRATVSASGAQPTGTIQFKYDGINLGSPVALNSSFFAEYPVDNFSAGTYHITAQYSGDNLIGASVGTLSPDQTVTFTPTLANM